MILAVMQPYFFPYLGYWQLVRAVDTFIILDDVNYIVRGWVNRNRILINGEARYVTIPLQNASQNRTIDEVLLDPSTAWRDRLVRSIEMAYRKAPHFTEVFPLVEGLLRHPAERLADYLSHQLRTLAGHLAPETRFACAGEILPKGDLKGQDRILALCGHLGATTYRNLPGGQSLYDAASFHTLGVRLEFVSMRPEPYPQLRVPAFVPALSVIDALMGLGLAGVYERMAQYDLVVGEPA
ncbi:MAG: WbqC family protein [Gammaproteobacteria bacterium]